MKNQIVPFILLLAMKQSLKKRIGEILIEDGVLSKETLEEALSVQKKEGGLVGQILIRMGFISEEDLVAALGKQLKIPYLTLGHYSINLESSRPLGEEFCRKNIILAFDHDDKRIYLAIADPLNDSLLEEVSKKTALKMQIFISTPTEILNMLDLIFSAHEAKPEMKKAG